MRDFIGRIIDPADALYRLMCFGPLLVVHAVKFWRGGRRRGFEVKI